MAKESSVWRGDDPGFQTQATGNYPAKSDVADKDNIYLSDQGWVYRHFKSLDKSRFWDEIIWAGDVTNPPSENDPVDPLGDPDPDFLNGDGYQFVSGPYPGVDPAIGTTTINAAADGDTGSAIPFSINVGGTLAAGNTYSWSVDGPGSATFSAGAQSGTFTGNTPDEANTSITFSADGNYTVTCLIKASAASTSGSIGQAFFHSKTDIVADTIGTVTVNGSQSPTAGEMVVYSAAYTGTAPQGDITYTWTATPSSGVTIADGDNPNEKKFTFTTAASVTSTAIKCVLTDASASDSPQEDTLTVVPHFVLGTAEVAGGNDASVVKNVATAAYSVTFTGASNPAADDMVYSWTSTPTSGSFSSASAASPTFTATAAGNYQIKCTVASADSDPDQVVATAKTLTVTDS